MKLLVGQPFDKWRDVGPEVRKWYGSVGDATCGVFQLPGGLKVIASQGDGWDHVSVSLQHRCPTWDEMVFVKRAFFEEDEWAIEYHPPQRKNISAFPYCLHLWRPTDGREIPIPPTQMIA